jgi:hypothetical protein
VLMKTKPWQPKATIAATRLRGIAPGVMARMVARPGPGGATLAG